LQKLGQLCLSINKVAERSGHFLIAENLVDIIDRAQKGHLDVNLCFERPVLWQGLAQLELVLQALLFVLTLPLDFLFELHSVEVFDGVQLARPVGEGLNSGALSVLIDVHLGLVVNLGACAVLLS